MRLRSAFLSLLFGLAALAQAPPAGTAAGSVRIDGKPMALAHVYAWAQPNPFEPGVLDTVLLFTPGPVAPAEFAGVEGLFGVAQRLEAFALFTLDRTGRVTGERVAHPALGKETLQLSGSARTSFQKQVLGEARVEGRLATTSVEQVLGHAYEVQVVFAVPVVPAPKPEPLPDAASGQPLPPGGGEPGKAYLAFCKALAKKDPEAILGLMRKGGRTPKDEAQLREGIEFMAALQPSGIRVVKGYVAGDRAALWVEGKEAQETQYGTIALVREAGAWRIGKQKWSNQPPK